MIVTHHAQHCGRCDCHYAVVMPADGGNVGAPFEYEPDGFTVSTIPHICWPRGERVGRLITARREAGLAGGAGHTCTRSKPHAPRVG